MIRFTANPEMIIAEAGDEERPARIAGVAVPWSKEAVVSGGQTVKFLRGAFDVTQKAPKLVENHDLTQLRGTVTELRDDEDGLYFEAQFANTRASQDAVALVKAGAYDSVSVGAVPEKFKFDKAGTMIVSKAKMIELSLVAVPAFSDAVITEIAASADPEDDETQPQDTPQEDQVSEAIKAEAPEAPATIPTQPIVYATAARPFKLPTPAEYLAKMIQGGAEFQEFNAKIAAAAPDVTTTSNDGILPETWVQPVYSNLLGLRPVVDAIGTKAMPGSGKVFVRPSVATHTSIGVQSSELATLTAGEYKVQENNVTKATYGGYVSLSEQLIDWSDPAVINLVLGDMAKKYADATDNVASDNLVSGATNTVTVTSANYDDPEYWVLWIYQAAEAILKNADNNMPTHIFLAANMWRQIGQLTDSQKRPLFPQVGPMNAFGSMTPGSQNAVVFGLTAVVDKNFADDVVIVGNPTGYEIFEQQKGAISIDAPSTLSRTLAFRGYFATLMIDAQKFRKFNWT